MEKVNVIKLKAKIALGLLITQKEYAYAVLYLNLDPKKYSRVED